MPMMIGSFLFKQKARQSLKGNWQTALVVTFFAGVFATLADVLQSVTLADVQGVMDSLSAALSALPQDGSMTNQQSVEVVDLYRRLFAAVDSIPQFMWIMLIGVNVLSILFTPVLALSCNRYFIRRIGGEDPSVKEGLLGCMRIWLKALWLQIVMTVKIFLWSLPFAILGVWMVLWLHVDVFLCMFLFVIPGIIAALRYSMAPYYMAEDPTLKAGQAIAKSKETMKDKKLSYFILMFGFWILIQMIWFMQNLFSTVITLVVVQFALLAVSTYMNASSAAFYCAVTKAGGVNELLDAMRTKMREMGMDDSDIHEAGFAPQDDNTPDDGGDAE